MTPRRYEADRLKKWAPNKLVIQHMRTNNVTGKTIRGNGLAGRICNPSRTASWVLVLACDDIIRSMLEGKYAR